MIKYKIVGIYLLVSFLLLQLEQYVLGQKSTCQAETYMGVGSGCLNCSFKCQVCGTWSTCLKCQPGYTLFSTADNRIICIQKCKTLWVTDSTGSQYLQGFYFEGKCKPCMKGCLNCNDISHCYECGNYKTGITTTEQNACQAVMQGSCPIGTGLEQRVQRCFDCSFSSQKFYLMTPTKPIDPVTCDPANVYDALYCPAGSIFARKVCITNPGSANAIDINAFQAMVPAGCMSLVGTAPSFQCFVCSPFYTYTPSGSRQICGAKTNGGIGNCEYKQTTNACFQCSQHDTYGGTIPAYSASDVNRNDVNDQDATLQCPIKEILKQRYSYNIGGTVCTSFYGILFPNTGNQVCLTTCPSSIDDKGQYSNYYTQFGLATVNANDVASQPIACVTSCGDGYAVDSVNYMCYQCTTVANCSRCSLTNLTQCISCKSGYQLNDSGNCVSVCPNNQITINNVSYCLICNIPNCTACSSPTQCLTCNNNGSPASNCKVCQPNFYYQYNDPTQCITCNTSYEYFYTDSNGVCHETCGKGLRITDEIKCDDGNSVSGDGCSSTCQIENNWRCLGGTPRSKDSCVKIDLDQLLEQNTDPTFNFSVQYNLTTSGQPLVSIVFTQNPILQYGATVYDAITIKITSLSSTDYSYTLTPITNRMLSSKWQSRRPSRNLAQQYGYYGYLQLNSTLRNQEVMVFINQTLIKNANGMILPKNSDTTPIPKYIFTSSSEQSQIDQTNTAAKSAQSVALASGLSFAMLGNFYNLMAIVDITELIYYFLFMNIDYPENAKQFFEQFDNFQMDFLPNPFEEYLNDVNQNCNPHVEQMDTDCLFVRNSGNNVFAVSMFVAFLLFVFIVTFLVSRFTKFEKAKKFLKMCLIKVAYNFSQELVYVVFLNFAASCFLQLQDTSIGNGSTKEHKAELINMISFSVVFALLFIIPTYQFIFIYRNRKIIEYESPHKKNGSNSQLDSLHSLDSPETKSLKGHAKLSNQKDNFEVKSLNNDENHATQPMIKSSINSIIQKEKRLAEKEKIFSSGNVAENDNKANTPEGFFEQEDPKKKEEERLEKEHEEFMEKYEPLLAGLKTDHFNLYIYNVITYYRKLIMMSVIMCLMDYPEIQLILLILHHIGVAVYIAKYMPFEKIPQNGINVITEILFIILEAFVMRLSSQIVDDKDETERRHIGLWIIWLFLSIIGVNSILMILEILHKILEVIHELNKKFSSSKRSKVSSKSKITIGIGREESNQRKTNNIDIYQDNMSIPPTVNNSFIITSKKGYESQTKIQNEAVKIKINSEGKISQEPRNIPLMDSFTSTLKTQHNKDKKTFLAVEKAKFNPKETSPMSEEGSQPIHKKQSSDEDDEDYNIPSNFAVDSLTPTSTLPLTKFQHRRRSTKTQDQTPFNMKNSRLSIFKSSQPTLTNLMDDPKNLKSPSLEEVHEASNSPSSSSMNETRQNNKQYTVNKQPSNFSQVASFQSGPFQTPGRESFSNLNSPKMQDSKNPYSRPRNVTRLSIFNLLGESSQLNGSFNNQQQLPDNQ